VRQECVRGVRECCPPAQPAGSLSEPPSRRRLQIYSEALSLTLLQKFPVPVFGSLVTGENTQARTSETSAWCYGIGAGNPGLSKLFLALAMLGRGGH